MSDPILRFHDRPIGYDHGERAGNLPCNRQCEIEPAPGHQRDLDASFHSSLDGVPVGFGYFRGAVQQGAVDIECNESYTHTANLTDRI